MCVNLAGLNHGAACVIITRRDWLQFLKQSVPDDHPIHTQKHPDPNTYLLTNHVFCPTYHVILRYRSRWGIEVMFRDLKQHLGLTVCQHRNLEAVRRHVALSMCAYVCLHLIRQESRPAEATHHAADDTIGAVKKRLQSQVLMRLPDDRKSGLMSGVQRPMPREVFEHVTAPTTSQVISHPGGLLVTSLAFKELDKNA